MNSLNIRANSLLRLGIALTLIVYFEAKAADVFYKVPFRGVEGDTSALEPLGLEQLNVPSCRYQQVYGASDFGGLPEGGIISQIIFRSDRDFGRAFTTLLPDIRISLSVTPRGPDQLSVSFSENIGIREQTVYGRGSLVLSSSGAGTPDTTIVFQNPYFYNPAEGNLLLEVLNFSQTPLPPDPRNQAGPLDAENNGFGPDTVSRVFAYDANATSGVADSIGLVTFFRITPIPEPSTAALAVLSVCIFAFWQLRRKLSAKKS